MAVPAPLAEAARPMAQAHLAAAAAAALAAAECSLCIHLRQRPSLATSWPLLALEDPEAAEGLQALRAGRGRPDW